MIRRINRVARRKDTFSGTAGSSAVPHFAASGIIARALPLAALKAQTQKQGREHSSTNNPDRIL
jgi:hypothetical protein